MAERPRSERRIVLTLTLFAFLATTEGFLNRLQKSARLSSASLSSSTKTAFTLPADVKIVDSMPMPLPQLKNKFYLLRHGQSTANVAGVISSCRSLAYSTRHGLTQTGIDQGKASATLLVEQLRENGARIGDKVLFVSSPFARAIGTAQACLEGLGELSSEIQELGVEIANEIPFEEGLMERFFGRLDDEAIYTYAYVWPVDKFDPTHTAFDVESVAAVASRLRDVILKWDADHENTHIVMTSHADVLQICQLYAANVDNVGEFSSYRFANGEVRRMLVDAPDSLPEPSPLEAPKRGTGM